jgi:hypothetical protein
MKRIRPFSLLVLLALAFGLFFPPGQAAHADTGPKPTMDFSFIYELSPAVTIVSGTLLECSSPDCADAAPLEQLGPQGFSCEAGSCSSMAYGYSKYHRLSITFSDGQVRESNVFTKKNFNAHYKVTVRENDLSVTENWGLGISSPLIFMVGILLVRSIFNPGLLVTLAVELLIGLVYVLWRKRPWLRVLGTILWMNLLTQPLLWFMTTFTHGSNFTCAVYILEIIVLFVEAWILFRLLRRKVEFLEYSECFWLSLVMNAASFGLGLLLPL